MGNASYALPSLDHNGAGSDGVPVCLTTAAIRLSCGKGFDLSLRAPFDFEAQAKRVLDPRYYPRWSALAPDWELLRTQALRAEAWPCESVRRLTRGLEAGRSLRRRQRPEMSGSPHRLRWERKCAAIRRGSVASTARHVRAPAADSVQGRVEGVALLPESG